jgi:hypothetical protein
MKRKTVFVLFKVPEADSVAIKRREPPPRGACYLVPKSKVIIDQRALTGDESVKTLVRNVRGERVAKRIVINTSDRPKTIQAVGR